MTGGIPLPDATATALGVVASMLGLLWEVWKEIKSERDKKKGKPVAVVVIVAGSGQFPAPN